LIDKVYKRKNLEIAWEKVKANQGAGGVDGESNEAFGERLEERLTQLHEELRTGHYRPQPVRQCPIPKTGKPSEYRMLGIPTIFDRVCQQALLNRLEPLFESLAKCLDALAVHASRPLIGFDSLPGHRQVLPLVNLIDQ